jgi:hypothetical protein
MDIRRILDELRSEQHGLEKVIRALEPLAGTGVGRRANVVQITRVKAVRTGRRPMSAAARRRLSELMKRRWAQRKARARAA